MRDCELRVLPEIRRLGAKRAKFAAYAEALNDFGDFIYLDADIVVLEELDALQSAGKLKACADDLSACPFIADRRRPWPGDAGLINERYVNSGILGVPQNLSAFLECLRDLSQREEYWQRYIFPGKLYDNHFLCAYLNVEQIPIDYLDEEQYNWQGFIKNGSLQVCRRGDQLVNIHSGKPLKLAHFAGVQDVDRFLCGLPLDVGSLLCERGVESIGAPRLGFVGFQASLSGRFREPAGDPFVQTVYEKIRSEMLHLADIDWDDEFQARGTYFADPESLLSLVYSQPNSDILWNGLQCGGAYLDGQEYNHLAQLLKAAHVQTVVEVGAGETTQCMLLQGVHSLALEPNQGPWLERAQAAGCRAIHVPFLWDAYEFAPEALQSALSGMPQQIDLVFIDSPTGTKNRSRVLNQLLQSVRPRFVLFHDAHRDSSNLYAYQLQNDLRLVDYFPSHRGMVLFSVGAQQFEPVPPLPDNIVTQEARWSMSAHDPARTVTADREFSVRIRLENKSTEALSTRYRNPVHVSYHWLSRDGANAVVFDGLRTPLPFDVHPGDSATFPVRVKAPAQTGDFRLHVALVQEMISWFDGGGESSCILDVTAIAPRTLPENTLSPALLLLSREQAPDKEVLRREVLESLNIITTDMETDGEFARHYDRCRKFTITSLERMYAMWQAVRYVSQRGLTGDIVECGTWMGGNGMLAALALSDLKDCARRIWLYDTFDGMTRPSAEDVRHDGQAAAPLWEERRAGEDVSNWWRARYDMVQDNVISTDYPPDKLMLVKGRVEDTIPCRVPDRIAVLRLDTDWYTSTRHEMTHLFPRLVSGGILIVDDYGWWQGSRRAVDEYLKEHGIHLLLDRIDSCGARMAIKI